MPVLPEAIVDATGFEARHISQHYRWKRSKRKKARVMKWPKLTTLCESQTHLWVAGHLGLGPSNEAPPFAGLMRAGANVLRWHRLLADAAYDSEFHHRLCREELQIAQTIIPINPRGRRRWPTTRYRRQMKKRFFHRLFHQRWQTESAFSRHKRRLGSALRAHTPDGRQAEVHVRILTHNLLLTALAA